MKRKIKIFSLLILLLLLSLIIYVQIRENRKGWLTVSFLDVGQGDAIFIDAPNGNQVLIDGGASRNILREISKVIPFYDRKIDVLIATHPDADHIGGLNDVVERFKTDVFIEPGVESDTPVYIELKKRVANKKIRTIEARSGMVIDLGSGASIEIIYPVLDPRGMETNTASIVGRLKYGTIKFLLTGDSPKNIEDYLVAKIEKSCGEIEVNQCESNIIRSDVLKVGHHGSNTSTSENFVKTVNPKYAIISAGKDNRYGHPHQEVIENLTSNKVEILNTAELGRIIFKTDGQNLILKK